MLCFFFLLPPAKTGCVKCNLEASGDGAGCSGAGQRQGRDLHILLVYAWSVPRREMRLVPGQEAGRKTDAAGGRAGGQDCGDGLEVS